MGPECGAFSEKVGFRGGDHGKLGLVHRDTKILTVLRLLLLNAYLKVGCFVLERSRIIHPLLSIFLEILAVV